MTRELPRRRARAIAISASADTNRKQVLAVKAIGALALVLGVFEALWTVQHVLLAR